MILWKHIKSTGEETENDFSFTSIQPTFPNWENSKEEEITENETILKRSAKDSINDMIVKWHMPRKHTVNLRSVPFK